MDLPQIDEHAIEIDAPPSAVWSALGEVLPRAVSAPGSDRFVRLIGAQPARSSGNPLEAGSSIRGFRVARAEPGAELALEGHHRFARYALVFRIDPVGEAGSRLRAETLAEFPGAMGRVYRTLVIGTRGHVLAVRRILGAIRKRAERPPHHPLRHD